MSSRRNALGLTPSEATVLAALRRPGEAPVTRDAIMDALYGVGRGREPKIVDVFICRIRKALRAYEIEITNVHARGYRISETDKARLDAIIGPGVAREAASVAL